MPWQFLCVDGADAKSVFPLPERGAVVIGRSGQDVDIILNDLFVGRVHCRIEVSRDGEVSAKHLYGASGSFVNAVKIDLMELKEGDILRVGNTHLRLEPAVAAAPVPRKRSDEVAQTRPPAKPMVSDAGPLGQLQGNVLSHYEINDLLALSPFRAVYVAQDERSGQSVVLKVLAPEFPAGQEELARFIAVMKQALPLRHERLVAMLGVGKNGAFTWIAREHVVGESLKDVLQRQAVAGRTRPKWQRGLRLAVDLGLALEFLQRKHVIHGRLSPANILLTGPTRTAKLANLMIDEALAGSRLARRIEAARQPLDVAYLSPEQATPGAFVDELSDLYSLGALIYARLTGQPPFLGETVEETLEQIRTEKLTKPRQFNPTIPEPFEAIVTKMLHRHQEDRFSTPQAFLSALEPFAAELEAGAGDSQG